MKNSPILLVALIFIVSFSVGLLSVSCTNEIVMYRVTFDSQGGEEVDSIDVTEGSKIECPVNPTKAGYNTFDGWYTEDAYINEWDFANDVVNSELTLFAKWRDYQVGDRGPSGGYVFYDDSIGYDLDGENGIENDEKDLLDGDRYLEVASSDIVLDSGGWDDYAHIFGYYQTGSPQESVEVGTHPGIGTGESNTTLLVGTMGSTAYTRSTSTYTVNVTETRITPTTEDYAARLCYLHESGGYNDWFLPSREELRLIYEEICVNDLGGFSPYSYWSSSECDSNGANEAYKKSFDDKGTESDQQKLNSSRVRPVRSF